MLLHFNYAVVLEYYTEILVHAINSHKLLHPQWQSQFSNMTNHDHLMVEHRAKTVLCAKTNSVTVMQRRFCTTFQTSAAPARNTVLHFFKTFEEKKECEGRKASTCSNWSRGCWALGNQQVRQFMSCNWPFHSHLCWGWQISLKLLSYKWTQVVLHWGAFTGVWWC